MSDAQSEVISKLSELSAQIRELVIELRHTQRSHEGHEGRIVKLEDGMRQVQLDAAMNKPVLDVVRGINNRMWVTIITAAIGVAAMNVDWTKAFGG